MKENYQDFEDYIKANYSLLKRAQGTSKEDWIIILEKTNFKNSFFITKAPEILRKYNVDCDIVMSLSNFAYILWRHADEYNENVFLSIKEVIDNYDLLLEGDQEGFRDFKFYKLFTETATNKQYGIEVAIDKPATTNDEFVVHVNYLGIKNKKGTKHFKKLKTKWPLIDQKNRI